jgi:5'-methylthioadenosine phosphorylase
MLKDTGKMEKIRIGIIGGSGLYSIDSIKNAQELLVTTQFGEPSCPIMIGEIEGVNVSFLSRHGKNHTINPSNVNYRGNIAALKKIGVKAIISISAVGSLKSQFKPGEIVIVDQFYDNTKKRNSTFFDDDIVAHLSVADPICPTLSEYLGNASKELGLPVHMRGTYICIEGPQFSTRAESRIYRQWGADVIGMTLATEAKLAREAGMCYSSLAFVTDYDSWRTDVEEVSVDSVIKILRNNAENAKNIIKKVCPVLKDFSECSCESFLKNAVITSLEVVSEEVKKKFEFILG